MLENIDFVVKDIQILIPASPRAGSVTLDNSLFLLCFLVCGICEERDVRYIKLLQYLLNG